MTGQRIFHLLPILILLLAATAADARTYLLRPDGSGDFPDIATALERAITGDEIRLAPGVYGGAGNRDLDFDGKSLTLRGQSGDPADCVIDAERLSRVLTLATGEAASPLVRGITFRNGAAPAGEDGGGLYCAGVALSVVDCVFDDCAAARGGAIFAEASDLALSGCVLENCSADEGGALALAGGASLACDDTLFENNDADYGAGLYAAGSHPTLSGCTLAGNVATASGGALYCVNNAAVDLALCTLAANGAPEGSGVTASVNADLTLTGCIVAAGTGGAAVALLWSSAADVTCTDIHGNAGGDWTGDLEALLGADDNLSVDPRFCAAGAEPWALHVESPCAAANHPCGRIGAWDAGCADGLTFRAGGTSWSAIKGIFR